ncbi:MULTISPECIES: AAA family ATPase [Rhizobium]|uniref:ATPase n=1 Tax=Rhizobium tropici TaxID=398 RepID=A0A6P1CCS1_RHITR|nr:MULTISPECIES: AAA family ATPase [Rhizobium]AGB71039.1 hypothetical protein RTCIAT899_CH08245 [Rhizobium tropici CIAT 899]MBB4242369.1 putative ATPase [Rhizobium tropici]MBB5594012.1 putative ATPase [Rhizobium tropici]MBB6492868.1 putative ATPase [Rhizobium tropici]NEV13345.1 AAA family ATPase [Rhizobium tropici]
MRIRSVKFNNHPVLGDLNLDFTDPVSRQAADTVIIAGENGCGKTAILHSILMLISGGSERSKDLNYEASLELTGEDRRRFADYFDAPNFNQKVVTVRSPASWSPGQGTVEFAADTGETISRKFPDGNAQARGNLHPFRAFFDEVGIGHGNVAVSQVSVTELDSRPIQRSGVAALAQQIGQLLVDVRHADNEDAAVWAENNPDQPVPLDVRRKRISRFDDALSQMLSHVRFHSIERIVVDHINPRFQIKFKKGDKLIELNDLSAGEKQIILRSSFLLQHQGSLSGAIVLVDEPELGLHPNWQARILGFYRKLIPDEKRETTQFIVATHSPFVVHDAKATKVIILQRSLDTGALSVLEEPSYPSTGQERVVSAFDVSHILQASQKDIIVLVEGETDKRILDIAWQKIHPGQVCPYDFRNALNFHNIRSSLSEKETFKKDPSKKIVGIFDFDSAYDAWNGLWDKNTVIQAQEAAGLVKKHLQFAGWAILLPIPSFRETQAGQKYGGKSALSIELLFREAEEYPHLTTMKEVLGGAMVPMVNDGKKVEFSKHVASLPPESFDAFIPLFDRLKEVLDHQI